VAVILARIAPIGGGTNAATLAGRRRLLWFRGLSLGVRLAASALGYTVDFAAAIDTDPVALAVYRANLSPGLALTASAPTLVDFHVFGQGEKVEFGYPPELMNASLASLAPVDLFVAGPPCEGHSNLNNHTRREDPRNHLYLTAIALGVSLGARAILIENVPESKKDRRGVVQQATALLRSIGYEVETEDFKARNSVFRSVGNASFFWP